MTRRAWLQTAMAAAVSSKPNVLLILVDDMSWGALSSYGNRLVSTPHLDRLAAEGMRFTDAYVTPQCTPTRATLMTGQYTARNGMWHVIPAYGYPWARVQEPPFREQLSRDTFTLAKGMRTAGYRTACLGKWHLTSNSDGNYSGLNAAAAGAYGFDEVSLAPSPPNEYQTGDKGVDRLTDEAIRFMEKRPSRPFFCYLAHHTTHGPLAAPEPVVRKYLEKGYPTNGLHNATLLACIEHLDRSVGRLLNALDKMGIADRTAVFFMTDNGGIQEAYSPVLKGVSPERLTLQRLEFDNAPLRSGKGSAYEGGIRVPFVVRWPGVVRKGTTCRTPVHAVDLLPTLLAMAGGAAPADHVVDGVNLQPLLRGGALGPRALYWYMPFYDLRWGATPAAVIRDGRYKLIVAFGDYIDLDQGAKHVIGERMELFNLSNDIGEQRNLAEAMRARAIAMRTRLDHWIRRCGAPVPALNPGFDPTRALLETKTQPRGN